MVEKIKLMKKREKEVKGKGTTRKYQRTRG